MRGLIVLSCVAAFAVCLALGSAAQTAEKPHQYVGAAKCKTCHQTAAQGSQHSLWQKSQHAKAFETLGGQAAAAVAKEKGIEDPQKADECLKCHVTGHGVKPEALAATFVKDGVQCESCHGPGSDYMKMATMKGITSGQIEAASVGLVLPSEKMCVGCHNEESPTFKGFNYEEMSKKIAHPVPAERKAQYKKEKTE